MAILTAQQTREFQAAVVALLHASAQENYHNFFHCLRHINKLRDPHGTQSPTTQTERTDP